jgi:hypothetical protein
LTKARWEGIEPPRRRIFFVKQNRPRAETRRLLKAQNIGGRQLPDGDRGVHRRQFAHYIA